MYVKKSISLLLSGALFASLCTGCSQTTMEHHFFTDTETETEYITPINEIDVTTKITELENLLAYHEIEFETYLSLSPLTIAQTKNGDGITKENLLSNLEFVESLYGMILCCHSEQVDSEYELYDFIAMVLQNLDSLYNALDNFGDDDWEQLKNALGEESLGVMMHQIRSGTGKNTKYYVETCIGQGGILDSYIQLG